MSSLQDAKRRFLQQPFTHAQGVPPQRQQQTSFANRNSMQSQGGWGDVGVSAVSSALPAAAATFLQLRPEGRLPSPTRVGGGDPMHLGPEAPPASEATLQLMRVKQLRQVVATLTTDLLRNHDNSLFEDLFVGNADESDDVVGLPPPPSRQWMRRLHKQHFDALREQQSRDDIESAVQDLALKNRANLNIDGLSSIAGHGKPAHHHRAAKDPVSNPYGASSDPQAALREIQCQVLLSYMMQAASLASADARDHDAFAQLQQVAATAVVNQTLNNVTAIPHAAEAQIVTHASRIAGGRISNDAKSSSPLQSNSILSRSRSTPSSAAAQAAIDAQRTQTSQTSMSSPHGLDSDASLHVDHRRRLAAAGGGVNMNMSAAQNRSVSGSVGAGGFGQHPQNVVIPPVLMPQNASVHDQSATSTSDPTPRGFGTRGNVKFNESSVVAQTAGNATATTRAGGYTTDTAYDDSTTAAAGDTTTVNAGQSTTVPGNTTANTTRNPAETSAAMTDSKVGPATAWDRSQRAPTPTSDRASNNSRTAQGNKTPGKFTKDRQQVAAKKSGGGFWCFGGDGTA